MTISLEPVLEVEASIADKDGRPEPLAGQVFYVLEQSPVDILRAYDHTSEIAYAKAMNALRNLAVRFLVTDSQGKAEIKQLKTGTYYICGIKHSPQGAEVWNVEIELLPGKNRLILNDENMTVNQKI